jgi:predicted transcriptional regulator
VRYWTRKALGPQPGGGALDTGLLRTYLGSMDAVPIKPERKAQLDDYAQRYGQNVTDALDEALAAYLEWERTDYREAVEGIRRGYEDVGAGRTRPAAEFFAEMRRKYPSWLRQRRNPNAMRKPFLSGCIPSMPAIIASLAVSPARCPLAPENAHFPYEVRHLLYGRRPHVYRILFTAKGDTVSIPRISVTGVVRVAPRIERLPMPILQIPPRA